MRQQVDIVNIHYQAPTTTNLGTLDITNNGNQIQTSHGFQEKVNNGTLSVRQPTRHGTVGILLPGSQIKEQRPASGNRPLRIFQLLSNALQLLQLSLSVSNRSNHVRGSALWFL